MINLFRESKMLLINKVFVAINPWALCGSSRQYASCGHVSGGPLRAFKRIHSEVSYIHIWCSCFWALWCQFFLGRNCIEFFEVLLRNKNLLGTIISSMSRSWSAETGDYKHVETLNLLKWITLSFISLTTKTEEKLLHQSHSLAHMSTGSKDTNTCSSLTLFFFLSANIQCSTIWNKGSLFDFIILSSMKYPSPQSENTCNNNMKISR